MSQKISDRAAGKAGAGFTLLETCIAVALSLLVGLIAQRFYRDSFHTYSQQEQIEERNQNANFTIGKIVEVIQQAGAGLPDTGWQTVTYAGGVLTVGSNPLGAQQFIGNNPSNSKYVRVDDATLFSAPNSPLFTPTHILVQYASGAPTAKFQIDTSYNASGFSKGRKNNATGYDSLYLASTVDLNIGDMVYGYREDQYLLLGDSLVIYPNGIAANQMVLAEDIDSLGMTFRDQNGNATTAWKNMRSVSITVRARTAQLDPRLKPPAYHKITLPMNVILRNKV